MKTSRLEAFSDGVLAIIITIMVLELHIPQGHTFADLADTFTGLLTYVLSFIYVGIYWNNHHHMFMVVRRVNGAVLWANLTLLFFLSLFPFVTGWVEESDYARDPVLLWGFDLLGAALAYYVLQLTILRAEGESSLLREAIGRDLKGKLSPVLYVLGILGTFIDPRIGVFFYALVAVVWLVPDRRLETYVEAHAVS